MKIKSIAKFQKKTTLLFIGFFCLMSCSEASNQQTVLMENNMPIATISTSAGEIKIELDKENATISVDNFISFKSTIPYFRFFLFGFIIWFCLEKKIFNLKVFYLILLFIISLFFFDSLFQYFLYFQKIQE